MLLKHRPPGIESHSTRPSAGLEHLEQNSIAVLRWLIANKVDFVVVGPVARAIRGDLEVKGPVAIVPAPYGRNFERLCTALVAEHAGLRADRGTSRARGRPGSGPDGRADAVPVKLTADKLARGKRWMLRLGAYDLDIEGAAVRSEGQRHGSGGGPGTREGRGGYQELLYEAGRFELATGISVEVAAPEDLEYYSHVRRTGRAPEFRLTRKTQTEQETA